MDKKMLVVIFSVISLLIIGGYIYVTYNKLTNKIKLLEKELDEFKSGETYGEITDKNAVGVSKEFDLDDSEIDHDTNENFIGVSSQDNPHATNNLGNNTINSYNMTHSNVSSESQSLETTQNEVQQLENELKNVEYLLDENKTDTELNYDTLDKQTTGRIDSILDDSARYSDMVGARKHTSSEFDDLENVPSDNNSELNELIKKESITAISLEQYSQNIAENSSTELLQSLEAIHSSSKDITEVVNTIENKSKDTFNNINDKQSDKQDIEISVIQKKFSVKALRSICAENSLSQSGTKTVLIERIIQNNLSDKLEKTSHSVKLTENLTH